MPRYASSTDVARLAGVSQSSVSRSYRPGTSISKRTREKVLAAAEQLGYRPSIIPRIMLSHRSDLIAVVIGGMYNPLYARMLEEFATQLHASGRQMLLVPVDSGHSLELGPSAPCGLSRRRDCQRSGGAFAGDSGRSGKAQDSRYRLQHQSEQRLGDVGLDR